MERSKRSASKVGNYRKFHLSGELGDQLQGKVGQLVNTIEDMASHPELEQELEVQTEARKALEAQAEEMKLKHEMQVKKLRTKELQLSIQHMTEAKEAAHAAHTRKVQEMEKAMNELKTKTDQEAQAWLEEHLKKLRTSGKDPEEDRKQKEEEEKRRLEEEKQQKIQDLKKQLAELTGDSPPDISTPPDSTNTQQLLMELKTQNSTTGKTGRPPEGHPEGTHHPVQ